MANSVNGKKDEGSWVINESDDDSWVIETGCNKSATAIVYRIREDVVCIEVDDYCASNVIEPLMKKYGFENVKWLLTK